MLVGGEFEPQIHRRSPGQPLLPAECLFGQRAYRHRHHLIVSRVITRRVVQVLHDRHQLPGDGFDLRELGQGVVGRRSGTQAQDPGEGVDGRSFEERALASEAVHFEFQIGHVREQAIGRAVSGSG